MTLRTSLTSLFLFLFVFGLSACDSNDPDDNSCPVLSDFEPVSGGPVPEEVADADYTTTDSGLRYYDITEGTGPVAGEGDVVLVHYTGWLENDFIFDSSVLLNRSPFPVTIGFTSVILGWTEGLQGMQEGGRRQLVIPPALAYGDFCRTGSFPANATMIFEVEIVDLTPAQN